MTQRTSLLFLLTSFLLTNALFAMERPNGDEGSPHKKQAASNTPLAQAAPVEEAPPACAPKKPKKPTAARKVLTHAYKCHPWDKEGFLWTHMDEKFFKPCYYIHAAPNPRQPDATWAQFIQSPTYATWKESPGQKPLKSICIPYNRSTNDYPWESDRNFFNAKRFAQVQSFTWNTAICVLLPVSFSDNLVRLDMKLPADGRGLCEDISKLPHLRSLTLETSLSTAKVIMGEEYYGILEPLSALEKLQHFSLDCFYFDLWKQEEVDMLLLDLDAIVKNNPNLKELYVGRRANHPATEPDLSGIEKILADRVFECLHLTGWEIKSLAWLNTEKLRNLGLHFAGTIEEGFSQPPLNLTELEISFTYFTFPFFDTLPLEQITSLALQGPGDLKILEKMQTLYHFRIWSEDCWYENDQGSTCLQDLDCLHLENLKTAQLDITRIDIPFVRMALNKKPGLGSAITPVKVQGQDYETLAEAIAFFDANQEAMQDADGEVEGE